MSRPWLDNTPIPIERLWRRSDSEPAQNDEQGYLLPRGHYRQRDCFGSEDLDDLHLALLRGESGSGKTYAVAAMIERLCGAGAFVEYIDLARVDTTQVLHTQLRPVLVASERGHQRIYVFFDDIEKCQLHAIERHLDDRLADLARRGIHIRIAYRAGTLTQQAEDRYIELLKASGRSASTLDLLPLTRSAVLGVLERVRQPADALLETLEQQGLVPLLVQPVTLRMIERLVEAGRPVQAMTRRQLYAQSCRLLCEPRSAEATSLDVDERLAIARRLAAVSVFCNRPVFRHREPGAEMQSAMLPLAETLGGHELVRRGDTIPVTMTSAREVLFRTGLFAAADQDAMGWCHNSIADYLAAEYVCARAIPTRQLLELLHLGDPAAPVLPQLEGIIGWLVDEPRFGLIERIIARAPLALLRSDVGQLPEATRQAMVRRLLELAQQELLFVWSTELPRRIARASYSAMLDDLRPWIADRTRNPLARVLAIRFAEACGYCADVSALLLAIALDATENLQVRHQAVIVIRDHGDIDTRRALRPLALSSDDTDEQDDLKGDALRALWPSHLTSQELFDALTPQRDESYLGPYEVFMAFELPRTLSREILPDALAWVCRQPSDPHDLSMASRLVDAILRFALEHLDDDVVRGLTAEAFMRHLRAHKDFLSSADGVETALTVLLAAPRRRALIEAIVDRLRPSDPSYLVLSSESPLLAPDDTDWLLGRLATTTDHRAKIWIEMIAQVATAGTEQNRQRILETALEDDRLQQGMSWFMGPIDLDSDLAKRLRDTHERHLRRANQVTPRVLDSAANEIVERACAGDLAAFTALYGALAGRPRASGIDLTSLPGWAEIDDEQRHRLVATAGEYLVRCDDRRADWLGSDHINGEAMTGLRALHLVAHVGGRAAYTRLPGETWQRWTGVLLAWPFGWAASDEVRRFAVANVIRSAPAVAVDVLRAMLADEHSFTSAIELLPSAWPAEIIELVDGAIPQLGMERTETLLRSLFAVDPQRAAAIAWDIADAPCNGLTLRTAAFNLILLRTNKTSRLRAIEQVVLPARPLTHAVLARLAHEAFRRTPVLAVFEEDELATLFIELERRYPSRADVATRGMHVVRSRERLAQFRDAVMSELRRRPSARSVEALQRIVAAYPEHPSQAYFQRMLVEAEVDAAESAWHPPTPNTFLALVEDATRSYVETAEQLAAVIVESLGRLSAQLNGCETPIAHLLWNMLPAPKPKDETALSDFIKKHLDADLVERNLVINREVEIAPAPAGVGRRPDIHVVATRRDGLRLTVYVEVKRCDNRHRGRAIDSQLVQQYLAPTGNRVGVYVVGHYDCSARSCCRETRDAMRTSLEAQARAAGPAYSIRSVVLDTSLPASMIASAHRRGAGQ